MSLILLVDHDGKEIRTTTAIMFDSDINVADLPALCKAAREGTSAEVGQLLSSGALVNQCEPRTGFSALHFAALKGHLDCVELLLNAPDIDVHLEVQSSRRETPLHLAIKPLKANSAAICRLLVDRGADIHAERRALFYSSPSPFDLALSAHSVACVAALLTPPPAAIAVVNQPEPHWREDALRHVVRQREMENGVEICQLLIDHGADVRATSMEHVGEGFSSTLLHLGAKAGNEKCVELLLQRQTIDVNWESHGRRTALHAAIDTRHCSLQMCKLLLEHGADVNAPFQFCERCGSCSDVSRTALHMAIVRPTKDRIELCNLLLDHGADVNASFVSHPHHPWEEESVAVVTQTALHLAITQRDDRVELCTMLLDRGADVNAAYHSHQAQSTLQLTVEEHLRRSNLRRYMLRLADDTVPLCKLLVDRGAVELNGRSLLSMACEQVRPCPLELIELLFTEKIAYEPCSSSNGIRAHRSLVESGQLEALQLVLERGELRQEMALNVGQAQDLMFVAVQWSRVDILGALFDSFGENVKQTDEAEKLLAASVRRDSSECFLFLLEHGVRPQVAADENGVLRVQSLDDAIAVGGSRLDLLLPHITPAIVSQLNGVARESGVDRCQSPLRLCLSGNERNAARQLQHLRLLLEKGFDPNVVMRRCNTDAQHRLHIRFMNLASDILHLDALSAALLSVDTGILKTVVGMLLGHGANGRTATAGCSAFEKGSTLTPLVLIGGRSWTPENTVVLSSVFHALINAGADPNYHSHHRYFLKPDHSRTPVHECGPLDVGNFIRRQNRFQCPDLAIAAACMGNKFVLSYLLPRTDIDPWRLLVDLQLVSCSDATRRRELRVAVAGAVRTLLPYLIRGARVAAVCRMIDWNLSAGDVRIPEWQQVYRELKGGTVDSLQHMCRVVIRHSMANGAARMNLPAKIETLMLPRSIKNYLMYS